MEKKSEIQRQSDIKLTRRKSKLNIKANVNFNENQNIIQRETSEIK